MNLREWSARVLVFVLLAASASLPFVIRQDAQPEPGAINIEMHARIPENGGWSPETITAEVGQPVHLRLVSDDVVHSFAIGQSDEPAIDLVPGEVVDTTLVFDKPGKYTYYCTRWCGVNHWRMRGTIEVSGEGQAAEPAEPPLFVRLGIDLEASPETEIYPSTVPSSDRGAKLAAQLPAYALEPETYRASSPAQLWQRLRAETSLQALSDADLWDAAAYVWSTNTTPEQVALGASLFAQNCAACHGESGQGDGVMLPQLLHNPMEESDMSMMDTQPPDFSDPAILYGESPARIEGKMLRGGMGTGMPYWGPIFKSEEMDAIVAYLYTLQQP